MSLMTRIRGLFRTSAPPVETAKELSSVPQRGWFRVLESFSGAWQQGTVLDYSDTVIHHGVYSCATLIASDIAKLRIRLVELQASGVWREAGSPAYSPVLRKPNNYQTRIQFWENWMLSKLLRGNTYVLKSRDARGVVNALYILDPSPGRVTPMVTDDGVVFYKVRPDNLAGVGSELMVPASEIIHDRWNCISHPLVGTSPILAASMAATQAQRIQQDAVSFFANRSQPSGILVAPGEIGAENAARLKAYWDENYSGDNSGKIAVLGDGMKFEPLRMTAEESQLIDQLRWSSEVIASVFHVPAYKIGIGSMPTYNNIQALNVEYYSQALQRLIEDAEVCLDEGLGLPANMGTDFDLDGLLRMDSVSQVAVLKEAVGAGVMSPNEARAKVDLPPVEGGEAPYLQQQNYSLAALAKRDASPDPFGAAAPAPASGKALEAGPLDDIFLKIKRQAPPPPTPPPRPSVKRHEVTRHDSRGRILEFKVFEEPSNE